MISETQLEILNSKETNYTNPVTSNVQNPSTYELASTKQVTSKSNEDNYLEVDFKDDEDDEYKTSAEGKKENTYTVSFTSSSLTSSDNNDDDNNIDNDTNNTNVSNNTADEDDSINMKQFKQLLSKDEENDELISEYGYDKFFELFDKDNDGKISTDEIKEIDDTKKSISDFTTDDIKKLINSDGKGAKDDEEETELSPELIQKLKDAFLNQNQTTPAQSSTPVQSAGSTGGSYAPSGTGSTGGGGSSSSGASTNSTNAAETPDEMNMEQLKAEQAEKQSAVDNANDEVAKVQSGENAEVQNAIQERDNAQKEYEEALKEDDEVSEELKEKQKENQEQITDKEEEISESEQKITEAEEKIYNLDNEITNLNSKLSAYEASLSQIPAKTEDNENQHAEIDAKKAELEGLIADTKSQIESKEEEKSQTEQDKADEEDNLDTLKSDLEKLEEEREKIEEEILKTCSPETKEKLEAFKEARENVETVKGEQLELAQNNLSKAQGELEEVNASINELESMQLQLEHRVGSEGEDVVAFAQNLDGLSASEMKQIMQAAGCQFDDGAWCADFVTYVTKQVYGNDETPFDFANSCSNTAYCPTIENWASEKGILTSDSSQVQPGDFILYTRNGRAGHIGIVTSVNADGSVNTIEGNTSDDAGNYTSGVVNTHENVTDARSFVLMHRA